MIISISYLKPYTEQKKASPLALNNPTKVEMP